MNDVNRISGRVTRALITVVFALSASGRALAAPLPTALGRCCKAPITGPLTVKPGEAAITVRADGAPLPAGHRDDVYYTGVAPTPHKLPIGYRFRPFTRPLQVRLATRYPALHGVRFHAYQSASDVISPAAEASMARLLHRLLGAHLRLSRLGQGGHQVVWRACAIGGAGGARCMVAKVRKLHTAKDARRRATLARGAAAALRRDLVVFQVAQQVVARAVLLDKKGYPAPLRINGEAVIPAKKLPGPAGGFVRVAQLHHPEALADGVLVQELVMVRPSLTLRRMFTGFAGPDGALRDQAWLSAPKYGVNRVRVLGFLDQYKRVSRVGPDVIRLSAFIRDCAALAAVPTVRAFCARVRLDFRIPDDFLDRVRALEQVYRDSAGAVIRLQRANFEESPGNVGVDGRAREVGLDYNHGRNVGWDPQTMQFVIFDA